MLERQYEWLLNEGGPKAVVEALKEYGTLEAAGTADNPKILSWAAELGLKQTYSHDSIPWCGLFIGVIMKRAGKEIPKTPLWALSWAEFGVNVDQPMLGDVLVFKRDGGGHVTLYVAENANYYFCLGGNQADKVCISMIKKDRLYKARRPVYNQQPANVRVIKLNANGQITTNEA